MRVRVARAAGLSDLCLELVGESLHLFTANAVKSPTPTDRRLQTWTDGCRHWRCRFWPFLDIGGRPGGGASHPVVGGVGGPNMFCFEVYSQLIHTSSIIAPYRWVGWVVRSRPASPASCFQQFSSSASPSKSFSIAQWVLTAQLLSSTILGSQLVRPFLSNRQLSFTTS